MELIVVTGGLGFIGGYVTRALIELGREVVVLTRGRPATPDMQFALRDYSRGYSTEIASVEDLPQLPDEWTPRPDLPLDKIAELPILLHDRGVAARSCSCVGLYSGGVTRNG